MTDRLGVESGGGVLRVTFRRPEAFNALTDDMAAAFVEAMVRAEADDQVRAVLVTGEGAAFSAGADLAGPDPVAAFDERTMDGANALVRSVVRLGKPVVAAVNGVAAGVGASLCFAADLAVAAESASFVMAFSRIGLMPDGGSTLTLAAAVGRARAMRIALLGEALSAQEAYDAGLVAQVVPDDGFDDAVERVVGRLASGPTLAYAATKRAVNAATLGGLEDALDREKRGQLVLFGTADAAEGTQAFVERRRPGFTGR